MTLQTSYLPSMSRDGGHPDMEPPSQIRRKNNADHRDGGGGCGACGRGHHRDSLGPPWLGILRLGQKVTGTIAELKWEQPHAILWVNSGGKKLEVWLSPLQRMVDRGLTKDALAVGKSVTVDAQPHTQKVNEWKAQSISVDGKTYDLMR